MTQKLQGKKWFIFVLTLSLQMSLGIKSSANALINISLTMDPESSSKGVLCPGDRVELYCRHSETIYDPSWRVRGKGLPEIGLAKFGGQNGLPNHVIVEDTQTQEVLRIDPLRPDFNGYTYTCLYSIHGEDVLSSPLSLNIAALSDLPVTYSTTESSITLMWSTNLSCFEADISSFTVMWSETNGASVNDTVEGVTSYTLTELKPGTTYKIRVFAQSTLGVFSSSVLYVRTESDSTTSALGTGPDGSSTGLIAGIVVACSIVVVMILLAVYGVTVGLVIHKNTKQQSKSRTDNVGIELNKTVSMTINPIYGQIEFNYDKSLYANL